MNRRHLLIDRCLAGALTQDEWLELSEMIGKENVVRIQQGDKKLRDALLQVSLDDARDSGNSITMDSIRGRVPSESGMLRFLRKWGLALGIVFLVSVVIAIIPYISFPSAVDGGSGFFSHLGPMQLGIGAVLLLSLGIALWLDHSNRF